LGGRGPSRVPQRGGNGDDWIDVSPRRRKARRQGDRGHDKQRENKRHRDWDVGDNRQSRFLDSREVLSDFDDRFYSDWHQDRDWDVSAVQERRFEEYQGGGEVVRRGAGVHAKTFR
jgi:hypothetical protein